MFCAGIGNGNPAIDGGRTRVDELRDLGRACRQLIADWRNLLPTQSLYLTVPVAMRGEGGDVHTETHRAQARQMAESATAQPSTQAS